MAFEKIKQEIVDRATDKVSRVAIVALLALLFSVMALIVSVGGGRNGIGSL